MERKPGLSSIKNHKYPFKFLRSFLDEGRCGTGTEWKVGETIWRIFQKKGLTDLSLISGKFCNWAFGGLKLNKKLRYDYKLHRMCYIDDVEKLE